MYILFRHSLHPLLKREYVEDIIDHERANMVNGLQSIRCSILVICNGLLSESIGVGTGGGVGLSNPTFFQQSYIYNQYQRAFFLLLVKIFDKSSSPLHLFNFVSDTTVSWKKYCWPWKKFLRIYIYIFSLLLFLL